MDTREIVLDILLELEQGKTQSHVLIRSVLDKYDYLPAKEKAFLKRLAEGCIERQLELDYVLNRFSSVPVSRMKPLIRCLVRMGAYQILFMDGIPDSAACNEAVKLAAKRGFGGLKGFVNGLLRSLSRRKGQIPYPDPQEDPLAALSVAYSMPPWLVEIWLADYGRERTQKAFASFQNASPVSIRFSSRLDKAARMEYIARMERAGVRAAPSPYSELCYTLEHVEGVRNLPGYQEGAFAVQDVSSVLAVDAAGIGRDDFVVDICAAPGGKSLYAAEKAGTVLSRDVSGAKLELMEENRLRMRADCMTLQEWDARTTDEALKGRADVLLMDVPCSGLGLLGKKRDIKYRLTPEGLQELRRLQREIVEGSWQYVKPGGILLYSTCTVRKEENEEMCRWICGQFPFEPEDMAEFLPRVLADRAKKGFLQLLPGEDACDGFFFARLRRKVEGNG